MYRTLHGPVALLLGSVILGVALSVLAFTYWWGGPRQRLGLGVIVMRLALSVGSIVGVLAGLVLLTHGTEAFLGLPLGRWSGSPMVFDAWIALELLLRELVWTAGHARRAGYRVLDRLALGGAMVSWAIAKLFFLLTLFVTFMTLIEGV